MIRNKNALVIGTLVRLFIAFTLIFLVFAPSCTRVKDVIINPEERYIGSFESFVEQVNDMDLPIETFSLSLQEKSALVGFSKDADKWECLNCYGDEVVFHRPSYAEMDRAYICLCKGLDYDEEGGVKNLKCEKLTCEESKYNLANKIIIKGDKQWSNGFLFANGISGINGLDKYVQNLIMLRVQKESGIIAICSYDILENHKKEFGDSYAEKCMIDVTGNQ